MRFYVANLTKSYRNGDQNVVVIRDVSLEVNQGDFCAIMGKSGSGKTTLLNGMTLLDRIDSGEITYEDMRIDQMKENELANLRLNEFGFVFQELNLIGSLSLYENIALPAYEQKTFDHHRVLELIESLGIQDCMDKKPENVSVGERQRAAIARALVNEPKLLFADEPTGSLDTKNTLSLLERLKDLNDKGQTLIVVTHDRLVASYAKKLYFLKNGELNQAFDLTSLPREERLKKIDAIIEEADL